MWPFSFLLLLPGLCLVPSLPTIRNSILCNQNSKQAQCTLGCGVLLHSRKVTNTKRNEYKVAINTINNLHYFLAQQSPCSHLSFLCSIYAFSMKNFLHHFSGTADRKSLQFWLSYTVVFFIHFKDNYTGHRINGLKNYALFLGLNAVIQPHYICGTTKQTNKKNKAKTNNNN